MSTVKISELPELSGGLNANTSNSLFLGVDIPTGVTGKFTATQLAERLYANNTLVVGENPVTFPNVVAQFSSGSDSYVQTNHQNLHANGSGDIVITADHGTDVTHYIDMGMAGSNYNYPGYTVLNKADGYLLVQGGETPNTPGGNLAIGTVTQDKDIVFFQGGAEEANAVAKFVYGSGLRLLQKPLTFADGTIQNTASRGAGFSQAAFDRANTASSNTIYTQRVDTTQNTNIAAVNTYSISAYAQANASNTLAVGAYAHSNSVNTYAYSSYALANAVNTYSYSAYALANAVNTYAFSAYSQANASNTLAVGAFAKANAALANTTGTFSGDLTITGNVTVMGQTSSTGPITTGNLIVNGTSTLTGNVIIDATTYMTGGVTVNSTMVLANSNFSATEAAFRITASGSSQPVTQAGTLMQLTSKANTPARVLIDSFGTSNTSYPIIAGRNARGTVTSPSPTQNNDILLRIAGNSYGNTGYAPFGDARIDFVATENHSDTNRGSRIRFWNTPTGSNVVNEIASFNADSVYFTGVISPEKGFIYTPTVLSGAQTAFTIDFATTSLIRATLTADLTITLSNYVYGKVVEVWLTNTGGSNRTVTHGCTATNSSENSTTFTIPATSSAYLRYFSIDGDNANTFVAIQHA